jgi:hypothetical protein
MSECTLLSPAPIRCVEFSYILDIEFNVPVIKLTSSFSRLCVEILCKSYALTLALLHFLFYQSSSSSLARQPYVGPGLPQMLLPAKVSSYCFFRFRDKSLFQGGVVSPTPNPRLSWRAYVLCQGCLP